MKTKLSLVLTLWAGASTLVFAQPQLSLGVTGGLQVYPTHGNTFLPLLGASTWFKASKSFFVSGEYLRYQGVDLYPTATSGLLPARVHENSHTQRAAIGLHYLVKTYNPRQWLCWASISAKAGTSAVINYMSRMLKAILIFVEPAKTNCNDRFCLQA